MAEEMARRGVQRAQDYTALPDEVKELRRQVDELKKQVEELKSKE
jgi:polyhydroxyalkanoate synthesis regulator phasin